MSRSSFFSPRSAGGKSGEILIESWWVFNFLAFVIHKFLICKSLKRIMTPLLALRLSRWHDAKSVTAASLIARCSCAKLTHAALVPPMLAATRNLMLRDYYIWGLCPQKQVSQAGIINCITQKQVSQAWISNCLPQNMCNYLSLPGIPASGAKSLHSYIYTEWQLINLRVLYQPNHRLP